MTASTPTTNPPSGWQGPSGGPAFDPEPASSGRSQIAVYVVAITAMGIACTAADAPVWGFVAAIVLGAAIAIAVLAELRQPFGSLPGLVVAAFTLIAAGVLLVLLEGFGIALPIALVPLAAIFALGLDWTLVDRLRILPFAFGLLVVVALTADQAWTFAAGLTWLALALAALASLEVDRRVAQPQVAAMGGGPVPPPVRSQDLVTTVLIALAIGLAVGLVLSTPSCQRNGAGSGTGSGQQGQERSQGQEQGQGPGSNKEYGYGPGSLDHQYVPDPDGRYLVPNDGTGSASTSRNGNRIPSPESLPGPGDSTYRTTVTEPDGTRITYESDSDGRPRVVVEEPGKPIKVYDYRELPDGLTEIKQFDEDGNIERTYLYDPEGKIAQDADPNNPSTPTTQPEVPTDEESGTSTIPWKAILLVVVGLLLIAGVVALIMRRTPKPPPSSAPPWALALTKRIEDEGRHRGLSRDRSETLVAYSRRLGEDRLPDERLAALGGVVSDVLFGPTEPAPGTREWAETTFDEIVAAHPPKRGSLPQPSAPANL